MDARTTSRVVTPKILRNEREHAMIGKHDASALLRVEHALLLENLSNDRDSRVDGVGNDQDEGLRGRARDAGGEIADDACVDLLCVSTGPEHVKWCAYLEEVISTSHDNSG